VWLVDVVRIPDRLLARLASQLRRPTGMAGLLTARMLNRGNRSAIVGAVAAAEVGEGDTVADIGFGGGIGLELLLRRVGDGGTVHGADVSATMLERARRRFRGPIMAGKLVLHHAGMDSLPLPDACADAVITTNTVYFVDDLARALTELARVLRPSGRLVLGVGDPAAMARMPLTEHGFRLRPIAELVAAVGDAGLEFVEDRRVGDSPGAFHLLVCKRAASGRTV
jgi:arsenite methyltransferase